MKEDDKCHFAFDHITQILFSFDFFPVFWLFHSGIIYP